MIARVPESVGGVCTVGLQVSVYGVGKTVENSKTL